MNSRSPTQPLRFEPIFMERVWGGRRLERVFGKKLPAGKRIGESWEIVDRPEAQSVVCEGDWRGRTLHDLWINERADIFGDIPHSARFPLLAKLLDASDRLSLQVHPPAAIASSLGGEPKTELWYFCETAEGAEIFAGVRAGVSREEFQHALEIGRAADLVHHLPVRTGDSFYVPSGRLHGLGAGNLVVEIQQNSDTTYRVFDWHRRDESGQLRSLQIPESMRSIDFNDCEPQLLEPAGELLLNEADFVVEKWDLNGARAALRGPAFAIFVCLSGSATCAGVSFAPGKFFLVPACLSDASVAPAMEGTTLLRITLPDR